MRYTLEQLTTIARVLTAQGIRLRVPTGPLNSARAQDLETIRTALRSESERLARQNCHTHESDKIRNTNASRVVDATAQTCRAIEARSAIQ